MTYFKLTARAAAVVASMALGGTAQAFPSGGLAPLGTMAAAPIEQAQYYGGPRCFYPDGWHGPGYYRCGFRLRRGLGFLGGGGGGGGFHGRGGHFGGGGGGHFGGGRGGAHGGGGHGGGGHGGHR